jgi:hypothetical protein
MDRDYYTYLYLEIAFVSGKYAGCNKCRQTGWSYKMACLAINDIWFGTKQKVKVFSKGSKYINDFWNMTSGFRRHLIAKTGWNRQFWKNASKELEWHMIWKAQEDGRDIEVGRDNFIKGINTSTNSTNLVGGYNTLVISEESGVDSELLKNIGYVDASLKQGELVTGKMVIGGSVGELKDCEDLRTITYNPANYGFLHVPDLVNHTAQRLLFIPVQWNYIHTIKDPDDEEVILGYVKCYDEHGNSDIDKAMELIKETRLQKEKQNAASFTQYCSQNPTTLEELYQSRETNMFNTRLLDKQLIWLTENYKEVTVDLDEDEEGNVFHTLANNKLVTDFPLKLNSFREGSVVMIEPPMKNPKPWIYFAGVDPVKSILGKGESLMAIRVFKNYYEEDGELKGGYEVAYYTGRHFDDNDTFLICERLMKYYNAFTTIESDQSSFIEWLMSRPTRKYMLKRKQIPVLRDLVPNSSISEEEYGIRMNTGGNGSRIKNYGLEKLRDYIKEIIGYREIDGKSVPIYGVERIKDPYLITELLNYNDKGNFDVTIAMLLSLITARSLESNHIRQKVRTTEEKREITLSNKISPFTPANYQGDINNYNKQSSNQAVSLSQIKHRFRMK